MIRHFKPDRLAEVGCGYSTRLSLAAFLSYNRNHKVTGAINFLFHQRAVQLHEKYP